MRINKTFLLLSTFLVPFYASAENLEIKIVQDKLPVQKESVDLGTPSNKTFELKNDLKLEVVVSDETHVDSKLINSKTGEVLHISNQPGIEKKGPNLYLICSGKLLKWVSPANEKTYSCPQ